MFWGLGFRVWGFPKTMGTFKGGYRVYIGFRV